MNKFGKIILPLILFLFTIATTLMAGVEWVTGKSGPYQWYELAIGASYSISLILILGFHEFGHYFAARYHKIDSTLPFFIPVPPVLGFLNFGTMGAVIKIKSKIKDSKALMDVGAAGPIAGFIVTVAVLVYGFTHLPPEGVEYIKRIHPDYGTAEYGKNALSLLFGDSLLFSSLRHFLIPKGAFIPPMSEVYHYPLLCIGWFGLFVTSMNLVPVGQLDGGHIIYALFGHKKHKTIASISLLIVFAIGALGIIPLIFPFEFPTLGWAGWLFWAFVLFFFVKVEHPPVDEEVELGLGRKIVGYISIIIFIISFTPIPFSVF